MATRSQWCRCSRLYPGDYRPMKNYCVCIDNSYCVGYLTGVRTQIYRCFQHNRVRDWWECRQLHQNCFIHTEKRAIKQADFPRIPQHIDKDPVKTNRIFRSVGEIWRRVWSPMIEEAELCMYIRKWKRIMRFEFLGKIWEKVQNQEMVLKWVLDKR